MKWISRLVIMTLISAAVAVGLSYVSRLDESAAVFHTAKAAKVSDDNIVDIVSQIPLHLRVRRVELSGSIVSVDLLAAASADPDEMLKDLYRIPAVFFDSYANINQVLVRVLDGQGSTPLLAAADARRENRPRGERPEAPEGRAAAAQYLDAHYRMTYTDKWRERAGQKS